MTKTLKEVLSNCNREKINAVIFRDDKNQEFGSAYDIDFILNESDENLLTEDVIESKELNFICTIAITLGMKNINMEDAK